LNFYFYYIYIFEFLLRNTCTEKLIIVFYGTYKYRLNIFEFVCVRNAIDQVSLHFIRFSSETVERLSRHRFRPLLDYDREIDILNKFFLCMNSYASWTLLSSEIFVKIIWYHYNKLLNYIKVCSCSSAATYYASVAFGCRQSFFVCF
jgi:hypothetical protein